MNQSNSYNKTIVCDIDDTISFTTNRDWENAVPNLKLINKLNKLYDEGWNIQYYTARGSISCPDRESAKEKYLEKIISWFDKNFVKYNVISFDKPLAAYYIDDKGIKPEEFLNLEIEALSGGLSGASIERRGNKVYKTASNSINAAEWYSEASNYIITPKIHSLIGETLCLDYISKSDCPKIYQINKILDIFSSIPKYVSFSKYIERVKAHLDLYNPNYKNYILEKLESISDACNNNKSFMHGDFTLDNMINNNDTLYLIDPNYSSNDYSSWLLDISKLLQSAQRFNNKYIFEYIVESHKYSQYMITVIIILAMSHWIRMRKYSPDKKLIDDSIQELRTFID